MGLKSLLKIMAMKWGGLFTIILFLKGVISIESSLQPVIIEVVGFTLAALGISWAMSS